MTERLTSHTSDEGKEFKRPEKSWPNMSVEQRNEVYQTHREALAGDLSALRENLGATVWEEVAGPEKNYTIEATGKTISSVMLEAFTREAGNLGDRTPKEVMFYSLDYIQNATENQGSNDNIDKVGKSDKLEIYNEGGRWRLRLTEPGEAVPRINVHLFPPKPESAQAGEPEEVRAPVRDTEPEPEPVRAPAPETDIAIVPPALAQGLAAINEDGLFTRDESDGAISFNPELFTLLQNSEALPGVEQVERDFLVAVLKNLEGRLSTLETENPGEAFGIVLGALSQSIREELPKSRLSAEMQAAITESARELDEFGASVSTLLEAVRGVMDSPDLPGAMENLKVKLEDNYEYLKNTPPFDALVEEAMDVSEVLEESRRLFEENPDMVMPDFTHYMGLGVDGKITFDRDRWQEFIESDAVVSDIPEAQRNFYNEVARNLKTNMETINMMSLEGPARIFTVIGNALKDALRGANLDENFKTTMGSLADSYIRMGQEIQEFVDALLNFKIEDIEPEVMTELKSRWDDLVNFLRVTPPFDQVFTALENTGKAFGELEASMAEVVRIRQEQQGYEEEEPVIIPLPPREEIIRRAPEPAPAPEPEPEPEPVEKRESVTQEQREAAFVDFFEQHVGYEYDLTAEPMTFEYIPKGETEPVQCSFSSKELKIGTETYRFTPEFNLTLDVDVEAVDDEALFGLGGLFNSAVEGTQKTNDIYQFEDAEFTGFRIEQEGGKVYLVPTGLKISGRFDTSDSVKEALEASDKAQIDVDAGTITITELPIDMQAKARLDVSDLFTRLEENSGTSSGTLVSVNNLDQTLQADSGSARIYGNFEIGFEKV